MVVISNTKHIVFLNIRNQINYCPYQTIWSLKFITNSFLHFMPRQSSLLAMFRNDLNFIINVKVIG
ncbi:hypothetical protein SynA1528_00444 [Synechococcus sp. A15-28]|nr:hypothetical protein SynA1528_00444 [Synechococcus sp. A15-28]